MEPPATHTESFGGLIRGILSDLQTLIREEVALARAEIREQAARARTAAFSFGVAAGALLCGATFLLIAIAMGVADLLNWPVWAGFLIVALVLSVVGFVALSSGRRQLRKVHALPEETVTTLKENSAWIARRLSSELK
jgi:Na+/melibiose symporter-like transporter